MENKTLIEKLADCTAACNYCASSCLGEKEVNMLTTCIRLNLDCADICTLVAKMLARGSQHAYHLMQECREICLACATECEMHTHMKHCEKCASICRDCAELCEEEITH